MARDHVVLVREVGWYERLPRADAGRFGLVQQADGVVDVDESIGIAGQQHLVSATRERTQQREHRLQMADAASEAREDPHPLSVPGALLGREASLQYPCTAPLARRIRGCSSMAEPQSSKLMVRVRFPSSPPTDQLVRAPSHSFRRRTEAPGRRFRNASLDSPPWASPLLSTDA